MNFVANDVLYKSGLSHTANFLRISWFKSDFSGLILPKNKIGTPPWGGGVSAGNKRIKEILSGIKRIKENFGGFGISGLRISKYERALKRCKREKLSGIRVPKNA